MTYAFEAQLLDLGRLDASLSAYGFQPIGKGPLLTNGIRGALSWPSGLTVGLNMRSATTVRGADAVVPTVVQSTTSAAEVSGHLGGPVRVGGDLGFQAVSISVGSTVQGGALVYLGPLVQPRVTVRLLDGPGVIELTAGWLVHMPLGAAHHSPLWEEPFDRKVIQGPTLSVSSGLGTRGWP